MANTLLLRHVVALRSARAEEARLAEIVARARASFEIQYADDLASLKRAKDAVVAEETAVKSLARSTYDPEASGSTLCAGVVAKSFKTLSYAADAALAWAKQTKLALLPEQLDVKSFEKIAAATPLDFVVYGTRVDFQIASDLNKALTGVDLPISEPDADLSVGAATGADVGQAADDLSLEARIDAMCS